MIESFISVGAQLFPSSGSEQNTVGFTMLMDAHY